MTELPNNSSYMPSSYMRQKLEYTSPIKQDSKFTTKLVNYPFCVYAHFLPEDKISFS